MLRPAVALACLVVLVPAAFAQEKEIEGEFVKYDRDKMVLTLKIDDQEQDFEVTEETKLFTLSGTENQRGIKGLSQFRKEGRKFKMKIETDGEKVIVKEIHPQR